MPLAGRRREVAGRPEDFSHCHAVAVQLTAVTRQMLILNHIADHSLMRVQEFYRDETKEESETE